MSKARKRTKNVPLTPVTKKILAEQLEAFRKKFGREPGPDDPIFFDPEKEVPTPISEETLNSAFREAAKATGLDPVLVYAFEKTGLIVTEDNLNVFTKQQLAEWNEAIEEAERVYGKRR